MAEDMAKGRFGDALGEPGAAVNLAALVSSYLINGLLKLNVVAFAPRVLPPEIGALDLSSHRSVVRMEGNPWVPPIADQLQIGVSHVIDYIRSDTYKL